MSIATVAGELGEEDKVSVLIMESRFQLAGANGIVESMVGIGLDGCKQIRKNMEDVIRKHGARVIQGRI